MSVSVGPKQHVHTNAWMYINWSCSTLNTCHLQYYEDPMGYYQWNNEQYNTEDYAEDIRNIPLEYQYIKEDNHVIDITN